MRHLPKSIRRVIEELSKLPGVGPKTAGRLAFYLVKQPRSQSELLGDSLRNLHEQLRWCSTCFSVTEDDPCPICVDQGRDRSLLCVVEAPLDTVALEKTEFNGRYHVLGGVLSPIDGIGPEQLRVRELVTRLQGDSNIKELIIATNPSLEGEATALYITKLVTEAGLSVEISRIARGLPVGGDLEYADAVTLTRALEGRRAFSS